LLVIKGCAPFRMVCRHNQPYSKKGPPFYNAWISWAARRLPLLRKVHGPVCRPYNLSDADVSRVKNRLVERGYVTNVSVGIVAITAEGKIRASQFFC
jgi:hypothetical protein